MEGTLNVEDNNLRSFCRNPVGVELISRHYIPPGLLRGRSEVVNTESKFQKGSKTNPKV